MGPSWGSWGHVGAIEGQLDIVLGLLRSILGPNSNPKMALNSSNTTSIWPSRAPRRPQGGTQEHRNCSKMPPSRTPPSAPRWLSRTVSDPKIALASSEDGPQNPQDKHSMPQQTFRTLGKSSRWHARSRHSPADREPPRAAIWLNIATRRP